MDPDHLAHIRARPAEFAPGGLRHLVLEIVAYAAEEAAGGRPGTCVVTLHHDGSVSVTDDGRGTATQLDDDGVANRKPVIATKDLRFFDSPDAQQLPDGHPRRGLSVVAALSRWLVHTNRRHDGSWTQRYEHGVPVTDLVPIAGDGTHGTTVHFLADETLRGVSPRDLAQLVTAWPHLDVTVHDLWSRSSSDRP